MATNSTHATPSRRGTILATCRSDERGVAKSPVEAIELIAGHGIHGDAHAGRSHREVSLWADESAEVMRARGVEVGTIDVEAGTAASGRLPLKGTRSTRRKTAPSASPCWKRGSTMWPCST